jgi:hypothetical protein
MANKRIHWMGQSNAVFAGTPNFRIGLIRDTLNALFLGLHTFAMNYAVLANPTPGTAMGGTALTNGGTSNVWMDDDGVPANAASWPLTATIGQLGRDYVTTTLDSTARSETDLIIYFWWEYDSRANGDGAATAAILDAAINEYVGTRLRADYGKTAAQLPVLLVGPSLYNVSTFAGQDLVTDAFNLLAARSGRNFTRFPCLTRDTWWGRDTSADGGLTGTDYTAHATDADLDVLMRRLARFIAQHYGPGWGLTPRYSGRGPAIQWVEYVNPTTLDVWVQHDGGNDLVLGANAGSAQGLQLWNVLVSGARVVPTAISIPATGAGAGRRVRLTMPTMPGAKAVRLKYGHYIRDFEGSGAMYQRGGLDGAVLDNSDTWQASVSLILPAAFTGSNRVPMPVREQRDYIQARVGAPPTT